MSKEIIIKLEEELRLAMLNSDVEKLNTLLAESLVFTLPDGTWANKQMDLVAHRSGLQKLSKLELLEQRIEIYNNFAVVAVKMELNGRYNTESIDGQYAYTRMWAILGGSWQIVAGHVSLL